VSGAVGDITAQMDQLPPQATKIAPSDQIRAMRYVASRCASRAMRRHHRPLRHPVVLADAAVEATELLDALGLYPVG